MLYTCQMERKDVVLKHYFFYHLATLSWSLPGFVECFLRTFQKCTCDGQNQQFEEKELFPETFSHHCHTLSEKTLAFLRNLLGMTAESALYVSNGFVEHLKEKTFSEKVFCTPFVDLERKKLGFRWTFSGVGFKFAIIVAEKTIWVRKLTFPKLLFDNFHTMKFFGTTCIYFFSFVGHWAVNVRCFGES